MHNANHVPTRRSLERWLNLGRAGVSVSVAWSCFPARSGDPAKPLAWAHTAQCARAGASGRRGCAWGQGAADPQIQGQLFTIHLEPPGLWLLPSLSPGSPGEELEVCQVGLGKVTWSGCFFPGSGLDRFLKEAGRGD